MKTILVLSKKCVLSIIMMCSSIGILWSQTILFDDTNVDTIFISNAGVYEIGVLKSNGAITHVRDVGHNSIVSMGSSEESLWKAMNQDYWTLNSSDYTTTDRTFDYTWDSSENTLTMIFGVDTNSTSGLFVSVTLTPTINSYIELKLEFKNWWEGALMSMSFPNGLTYLLGDDNEALFPVSYPGMLLESSFFNQGMDFSCMYPACFYADYLSLGFEGSNLAVYSILYDYPVRSVRLGLENYDDGSGRINYRSNHEYNQLWIENDSTWISPVIRLHIGESHFSTLATYKADNMINSYPSLQTKLGDKFDDFSRSPILYYSFGDGPIYSISDLADWTAGHPSPAIALISWYYSGSFEGYHPDYLPPSIAYGTTADFVQMVSDLHGQQKLVMPFTLPNWWHENSPTIQNLSDVTIEDISEIDLGGNPRLHDWSGGGDWGYMISPGHPFVQQRINQIYTDIFDTYGSDLIYEDVLGSHPAGLDFNPNLPSPMDLGQGWLDHFLSHSDYLTVTEGGYDRLSECLTGFIGTLYTGSPIGGYQHGSMIWRPYPATMALFHDKVAALHYWNASTISKNLLSWNLLFGVSQTFWIDDRVPIRSTNSPWIPVLEEFQQLVISKLIGKSMTDYQDITSNISQSSFEDITVTYNWDQTNAYTLGSHILSPHGSLVASDDGNLIAGIFRRYDGMELSTGDHFLIVESGDTIITVHHPNSPITDIRFSKPVNWFDLDGIQVYATTLSGEQLVQHFSSNDSIMFTLNDSLDGERVKAHVIIYDPALDLKDNIAITPVRFALSQNYPNPFNPVTAIRYQIPEPSDVALYIYDIRGRKISTLVDIHLQPGYYDVLWKGTDDLGKFVSTGVYFCRFEAGNYSETIKMVYLR